MSLTSFGKTSVFLGALKLSLSRSKFGVSFGLQLVYFTGFNTGNL